MKRSTLLGILAAVVVVALVIGAVLVGMTWGTKQTAPTPTVSSPPPSAPPTPSTPDSSAPSSPTVAGCVRTATASGAPITAAPHTDWYIADTGQTLPKTKAGPFLMKDRLALCYTPDSLGALTAAVNIRSRMLSDAWEQVARYQTEPVPTDLELQKARESPDKAGLQKPYPVVTGFRMQTPIANNLAVVELRYQGTLAGKTIDMGDRVTLIWTGTDWKQTGSDIQTETAGFTDWRP
ncbi:hypothetical protein [Aestuariimicrobium sp. T2.26MG-19.2B]|uniref:hypothetical protein n=1 Tax=Aestuariimicrobium sp. T2.26MG-19.2B TaxID=3040679 RepID=UPI00247792A8|nr:hypothetical protein [Aestuariimicrobium sp. T2.26MG-19.2B]CAI9411616.1 hypothetical protein AESSP_02686 [Aestuariimicrobium sp. T2.26MG-19.2B]